jgi:hypothetical protein
MPDLHCVRKLRGGAVCKLPCPGARSFPDEPQEWQAHVEASRQRIELMRRQHDSFVAQQPSQGEIAEMASKRVLQDDSLKPGDIVSTTHGLFRFRGVANRQPTPDDFVRLR